MKTALKLLVTAMVAMFFSSCSQQAIYYDASGNSVSSSRSISSGGKYVAPLVVEEVRVPKAMKPRGCTKCLSSYCPKPGCCGTVGQNVLSRATMQGGTGEPHLGLIPTMKTLAPEL